ncbi:MAG TPA: type II secretion system protein, partial [Micromonosporaceae bacterium]|nr:type II secretion system protein [Micromonosporaceae bacterium]
MLSYSHGAVQRPHPTHGRAPSEHGADDGFSLLEIVVSIGLISILMAAFTTFFINSLTLNSGQGAKQAAAQIGGSAMERVRALKGAAITAGRDEASTLAQWASPVAGVSPYLAQMAKAWDPTPQVGEAVALPASEAAELAGYTLHWYIGTCWQPKDTGGDCVKPLLTGTAASNGKVPFFGVVVGVTWSHRSCPLSACTHVEATLVSSSPDDPLFPTGQSPVPPAIDPTPPQGGSVTATGLIGTGPLYSGSTTINLLLNKGTSGVGLADDGYQLHRATGTLASIGGTANGTCSGYGLYTQ